MYSLQKEYNATGTNRYSVGFDQNQEQERNNCYITPRLTDAGQAELQRSELSATQMQSRLSIYKKHPVFASVELRKNEGYFLRYKCATFLNKYAI